MVSDLSPLYDVSHALHLLEVLNYAKKVVHNDVKKIKMANIVGVLRTEEEVGDRLNATKQYYINYIFLFYHI